MNESTSQNPENRPRKIYVLDRTRVFTPRERIKESQEQSQAEVVPRDNDDGRAGGWPRQGPPPAGLTCLNKNNCIEPHPEEPAQGTKTVVGQRFPLQVKKKERQLLEWIMGCVRTWGENHLAMLTISTRENITDHREWSRMFHSFTNVLNKVLVGWIRIDERQQRGAWHSHLIVVTKEDIRTGTDVEELDRLVKSHRDGKLGRPAFLAGCRKLASWALRDLWRNFRRLLGIGSFQGRRAKGRHYKFDNFHLMPIVKTGEAIAQYVCKYAAKGFENRRKEDKGQRLISCSRNISRFCSQQFAFNSRGGWVRRQKLKILAGMTGIDDDDGFRQILGKNWSWHLEPILEHMALQSYPSMEHAEGDGWAVRNAEGELLPGDIFEPPPDEVLRRNSEAFSMLMEAKVRRRPRSIRKKARPKDEPDFFSWIELTCGSD